MVYFSIIKWTTFRLLFTIKGQFSVFLEDIEDKEVRKYIKENCNNYREIHDILVPALREADRLGEPLSIQLLMQTLGVEGY